MPRITIFKIRDPGRTCSASFVNNNSSYSSHLASHGESSKAWLLPILRRRRRQCSNDLQLGMYSATEYDRPAQPKSRGVAKMSGGDTGQIVAVPWPVSRRTINTRGPLPGPRALKMFYAVLIILRRTVDIVLASPRAGGRGKGRGGEEGLPLPMIDYCTSKGDLCRCQSRRAARLDDEQATRPHHQRRAGVVLGCLQPHVRGG